MLLVVARLCWHFLKEGFNGGRRRSEFDIGFRERMGVRGQEEEGGLGGQGSVASESLEREEDDYPRTYQLYTLRHSNRVNY